MAACLADRCATGHPEEVRGRLLSHHDVPRLRHQPELLPLGIPEHHQFRECDGSALRQPRHSRDQRRAVRSTCEERRPWHGALYLPGHGTVRPCLWLSTDADRMGVRPKDRKSTRLNSSHVAISYAVFCLKKNMKNKIRI